MITYPNGLTADATHEIERTSVPALDSMLGHAFPALDHGFIRIIDYMGDDAAIVQAARVSYGTGTKTPSDDRGLIRYLMRHWHTTPFEMCEIKLHVKLPVFVARQWIRHRTANVNEYSARYSILDREFYIPAAEDMAVQSTSNKQGRGEVLSPEEAKQVQTLLLNDAGRAYDHYLAMIHDRDEGGVGLARELARMNLPTNIYTQWYWKVDLHNLMHFLRLRSDPHAQYEIRVYADIIAALMTAWVPLAHEAWVDYQQQAVNLSRMEIEYLRLKLGDLDFECMKELGMSDREIDDFFHKCTKR